MTHVKAVLFRADGDKPEWIEIDADSPTDLQTIICCQHVEFHTISDTLAVACDDTGRFKNKPRNKCFDSVAPEGSIDFVGDVVLLKNNEDDDDDESGASMFVDVTEADLASLAETLAEDARKRREFQFQFS